MTDNGKHDSIRTRKLLFDGHNTSYHYETGPQAIQRMCDKNIQEAMTKNRGNEKQLEFKNKQVDFASHWYEKKVSREIESVRESLRDHVAHRTVLNEVASDYEEINIHNGAYGKYGPNTTKFDLLPKIENVLKQMEPSFKRQKEADKLLQKRKKTDTIDRTLPTSAIFTGSKTNLEKQDVTQNSTNDKKKRNAPKLVLPPIVVKKSKTTFSDGTTRESTNMELLPSIFVTHADYR